MERNERGFFKRVEKIASELKKRDDFVVLFHYDADGCSAGAIMCKALEREGKKFEAKWVKQLYSEDIEEIRGLGKNYVFVDFGSSYLPELKKAFGKNFFVLDHHQTGGNSGFHLNPMNFGINGGTEISSAGVAYLVAKEINPENKDLCALAIVGACGDMQDSRGKLEGLNAEILKDAVESKMVSVKEDLRLYGRISRPLTQFLMFSSNPIIPGLTASEQACIDFLKQNHIPMKRNEKWLSYEDLGIDYKKRLVTALMIHMQKHGVQEWKMREMIGEVYTLEKEQPKSPLRDAKEFATLLNATGRHAKAEIGLKVCMGDREKGYIEALALLQEHRRELREGIELMQKKGIKEEKNFYFFDAESKIKESIIGIIAGMLYGSGTIGETKPIIAFARHEDGSIKVSARATQELVEKGLNLGKALKDACAGLGEKSQGGGHKIAAGCRIEGGEKEKERFLKKLNEKIADSYT